MSSVKMLKGIEGMDEKFNDILVSTKSGSRHLVCYFGGDVQNLEKVMTFHRDHGRYVDYSLENTVEKIGRLDDKLSVVCVLPSRMERNTFACYDNFVDSNFCGAPNHDTSLGYLWAAKHLSKLLQNVDKKLTEKISSLPKTLIGFSKGVVVLNQLLLDWDQLQTNGQERDFYRSISTWCWLDGGHNGGHDTWITSQGSLRSFVSNSNWNIVIKVTPRQVQCDQRPWIGKEEKKFRSILRRSLEAQNESWRLERTLHFEEEEPNIVNHFRIIDTLTAVDLLGKKN